MTTISSSSDWKSIDTIPPGKPVLIKTVKGIIYHGKTRNSRTRYIRRADSWGPRRVSCFRLYPTDLTIIGDVVAVAWKELE